MTETTTDTDVLRQLAEDVAVLRARETANPGSPFVPTGEAYGAGAWRMRVWSRSTWMLVLLVVIAGASVLQAIDSIQQMQDRSKVREAVEDVSAEVARWSSYDECMDSEFTTVTQCEALDDAP